MLMHLSIRDFAIIDCASIEFHEGFSVVTGETGAGKSIIVDALMIALGARVRSDVVRDGAKEARVEALFDVSAHPVIRARLEERGLTGDDPESLVVRRSISSKGRSRVLINGHVSTAATLQYVVNGLVDISGQHEQQTLLQIDTHVDLVDRYGELAGLRLTYSEAFDAWKDRAELLMKLQSQGEADLQRLDFLKFQLDEIDRVAPVQGEDEDLEVEHRRLAHAEDLERFYNDAETNLYSRDASAFDLMSDALRALENVSKVDVSVNPLIDELRSAQSVVEDLSREVASKVGSVELDPVRLREVDDRISSLVRLKKKYGPTLDEVLATRERLTEELETLDQSEDRLVTLRSEVDALAKEALDKAGLTKARKKAAKDLSRAVVNELKDMELSAARFEVEIERRAPSGDSQSETAHLGGSGADRVEFMWSANKGQGLKSLMKIASGGELSRLMLAVKRVCVKHDLVSLYIFDEVDTGLGGRAADAIGRKIRSVADGHQAITITHLAPIASMAHHHYYVSKDDAGGRTVSEVRLLDESRRIEELARMIDGGLDSSGSSLATAEQMLERARLANEAA